MKTEVRSGDRGENRGAVRGKEEGTDRSREARIAVKNNLAVGVYLQSRCSFVNISNIQKSMPYLALLPWRSTRTA